MEAKTQQGKFKILNIDGGGIKGLIPIYFCDLLEKLTGKKIYEIFDFFSGTSVGGIISLAFSQRLFTAGELLNLFLGKLKNKIFPSKRYFSYIFSKKSLYDPKLIEEVLQEIFGQVEFKKSKGNFLITGSELEKSVCEPCIFVNFEGKTDYMKINFNRSEQDFFQFTNTEKLPADFKLWHIARITSAAYPFFSKYKIGNLEFLDGGFTYNNPSFLAIKYLEEAVKLDMKNVFMLSLGCSEDRPRQSVNINFLQKNVLSLGSKLISNLDGLEDNMDNSAYNALLLADTYLRQNHLRIAPIGMKSVSLDAVDNESVFFLLKYARHMIYELKKLSPYACEHLGIPNYESLCDLTKHSRFHYYPRYHRYRDAYNQIDQAIKDSMDDYKIWELLNEFKFPKDVCNSVEVIKLTRSSGQKIKNFFQCNSRPAHSCILMLAMAVGHIPLIRKFKSEVEDYFYFKEWDTWTLFHTAAANNELAGIYVLIEDDFLEQNSINKFSDFCFIFNLKKDISVEKLQKLVDVFLTHKGKKFTELEAAKNETPLGLATKNKALNVLKFYKRCRDILNQKLKGANVEDEKLADNE